MGFPGRSESAGSAGDLGSISGSGRSPREGDGNPLRYSYLENPYGQRNLVDSPWGHKEPDTTFMFTFKQQQLIISYNSINWLISLLLVVSWIMCIAVVS